MSNFADSDAHKTRADLGWHELVAALVARTFTPGGAALAQALAPLGERAMAQARLAELGEARALHDRGQGLPLERTRDIAAALQRVGKGGALDLAELRDVGQCLEVAGRLRNHLISRDDSPRLRGRAALLADLEDLWRTLAAAIHDNPDGVGDSDGARLMLADRASPALGGLRRRASELRDELERAAGHLLERSHIAPHLQDQFITQRDERYVIPVRVDARGKVRGILHGISQSGQTVFIEPEEIIELNNRWKMAELEVRAEEQRILAELSALVREALPHIEVAVEVVAALDFVDAGARLATELRAQPPELADAAAPGARLDLRRARHPLMLLRGRECVANDIAIGVGQVLVVSGPNAGGKTVALKIAGLLSMMAAAGLPIPAQEGSVVPLFDTVFSDVGDEQSLERDLSTFSAHVVLLREFVARAARGVLVLLDEVAVGTDPGEGAALAQAVLEVLAARGATCIVTTHYERLKTLATSDARFVNASVGFDVEALRPTYELHLGVPGASGALLVARRFGLEDAICARAGELQGVRTQLESLLESVERTRATLDAERAAVAEARALADALVAAAEKQHAAATDERARARKGAHDAAVETLQRARADLDQARTVLRRKPSGEVSPAELQHMKQSIDEAAAQVHASRPEPPERGRAASAGELVVGKNVWVRRLGGVARVVAVAERGRVQVQAGVLKMMVPVAEVRIVDAAAPEPPRRAWREPDAPSMHGSTRRGWPTVDVRGERVDTAIGLVEKFLDDAMRAGHEEILIVHGHGTGALRDEIRAHLKKFPGVSESQPAKPEHGGDGATWVKL